MRHVIVLLILTRALMRLELILLHINSSENISNYFEEFVYNNILLYTKKQIFNTLLSNKHVKEKFKNRFYILLRIL